MKSLNVSVLSLFIAVAIGCGGGPTSVISPPPPQGSAQASVSIHDMPPTGVTLLSLQATITGMTLQPGNVSVINSPMTLEMTQLQGMSAYMGTVSLPAGNYTGMTITLSNPQMTFLNNTGGMMGGGMMGGNSCANGQVCQLSPTMMASSVLITGSPFPLDAQANTSFNLQLDFDLMDSMQSNMSMNPTMSSMMQQTAQGSNILDDMNDMIGVINSVNSGSNQFSMSFVQGMPSMSITADTNTTFEYFDSIGKPNSFSGLANGQIVLAKMQLLAGGSLHAEKVRLESGSSQVLQGMIVAINNSTQFDMVMTNAAPAFQGLNLGAVVRMNMQAGTTFDVDDTDLPVSGMSFAGSLDMMVGQIVQIQPSSALVNGTPPQLNTGRVRLMKTWMTAVVASKIDANTFTLQSLPGMFGAAGFSTMKVATSTQTMFENVSNVAALNVGDTVSVRGPMFLSAGAPTMIAGKVQKH